MITVHRGYKNLDQGVFGNGFEAAFFRDPELKTEIARRTVAAVGFKRTDQAVVPGVPAKDWSGRWVGTFQPPATAAYQFELGGEGGVRLMIDGKQVIDNWSDHPQHPTVVTMALEKSNPVTVQVEYRQGGGDSALLFGVKQVDPTQISTRYNPQFHVVKHLSTFVKPGARKLTLDSDANALAFLNPDGKVIIVWVNVERQTKAIAISNGTTTLTATLPATSFNTFVLTPGAR